MGDSSRKKRDVTPERWQSKKLLTNDERGSKIARNTVFDCHLSPVGRQMAIENSVSNDFDLLLSIVLTFSFAAYPLWNCRQFLRVRSACSKDQTFVNYHCMTWFSYISHTHVRINCFCCIR